MSILCCVCSARDIVHHVDFPFFVDEYAEEFSLPGLKVNVTANRYIELEKKGEMKFVGAFDKGRLAGASFFRVVDLDHYEGKALAIEAFYLRKDWRHGANGLRFLRALRTAADSIGAKGVIFSAPPGSALDKLCEKLGMTLTHKLWWANA